MWGGGKNESSTSASSCSSDQCVPLLGLNCFLASPFAEAAPFWEAPFSEAPFSWTCDTIVSPFLESLLIQQ